MYVTNDLLFPVSPNQNKEPVQGSGDDFSRIFQSLMSAQESKGTTINSSEKKSVDLKSARAELLKEWEEKTGLPSELLAKFLDLIFGQKLTPTSDWNKWEYRLDGNQLYTPEEIGFDSPIVADTNLSLNPGLFLLGENASLYVESIPFDKQSIKNFVTSSSKNILEENLGQFFTDLSRELFAGNVSIEELTDVLERLLDENQLSNSMKNSISNELGRMKPQLRAHLLQLMDNTDASQENHPVRGEPKMAMEENPLSRIQQSKTIANLGQILRDAYGNLNSKIHPENTGDVTDFKETFRDGLNQEIQSLEADLAEPIITGSNVQKRGIPTLTVPLEFMEPFGADSELKAERFEQFAKEFSSILQRSAFLNRGATKKIFIKLYPEHLGMVKIELTQTEKGLAAKIVASTQRAKEILESQLHGLRQAFIQQNLEVNRLDLQGIWQEEQELLNYHGNQQQQEQPDGDKQDEERGPNESKESFQDILVNYKI